MTFDPDETQPMRPVPDYIFERPPYRAFNSLELDGLYLTLMQAVNILADARGDAPPLLDMLRREMGVINVERNQRKGWGI